jgi:hypothetical protein
MRITIVASIAIETGGLTSASRATVLFFSRRFTLSRGPPERRLLGRTIRADCLRRMFAQALLVALTWGTELGLLSSHSARQSDNQKSWREKNITWRSRTCDVPMRAFMICCFLVHNSSSSRNVFFRPTFVRDVSVSSYGLAFGLCSIE